MREAIGLRVAHLLAGGYHRQARALTPELREFVFARDEGKCVACGKPGEEIDHIDGDSSDLANLRLVTELEPVAEPPAVRRPGRIGVS